MGYEAMGTLVTGEKLDGAVTVVGAAVGTVTGAFVVDATEGRNDGLPAAEIGAQEGLVGVGAGEGFKFATGAVGTDATGFCDGFVVGAAVERGALVMLVVGNGDKMIGEIEEDSAPVMKNCPEHDELP